MKQLMDIVKVLNNEAKYKTFPVMKTTFYGVKADLIAHIYLNMPECVKHICLEEYDNHLFYSFVIQFPDGQAYKMHSPSAGFLKRLLGEDFPIMPYKHETLGETMQNIDEIIDVWKRAIDLLHTYNWFIYNYKNNIEWVNKLSYWFPDMCLWSNEIKKAKIMHNGQWITKKTQDLRLEFNTICNLNNMEPDLQLKINKK